MLFAWNNEDRCFEMRGGVSKICENHLLPKRNKGGAHKDDYDSRIW